MHRRCQGAHWQMRGPGSRAALAGAASNAGRQERSCSCACGDKSSAPGRIGTRQAKSICCLISPSVNRFAEQGQCVVRLVLEHRYFAQPCHGSGRSPDSLPVRGDTPALRYPASPCARQCRPSRNAHPANEDLVRALDNSGPLRSPMRARLCRCLRRPGVASGVPVGSREDALDTQFRGLMIGLPGSRRSAASEGKSRLVLRNCSSASCVRPSSHNARPSQVCACFVGGFQTNGLDEMRDRQTRPGALFS